jgi:predicted ribosomally synthesized peptide with SipW-like signal peptide
VKRRILLSLMVIAVSAIMIAGATTAYFSDVETSNGNTFTAGKLDLQIDDGDANVVKFNITNMKPGDQPTGKYTLTNIGTINGYLDITKVTVTDNENDLTEPEVSAGDTTANVGELSSLLNIRLYFDEDKDGYISAGDTMIYNGKLNTMPTSFELNKVIPAGGSIDIIGNAVIDWWSSPSDNLAQSDTCTYDLEFTLNQIQ